MTNINRLQEMLDTSKRIVFFGGAGVSTDSGIPDFRSQNGLYNLSYKYPPEYMLSSDCFRIMPEEFFKFYNDKILSCIDAEPNYTHLFLTELEKAGKLVSVITQNIDGLHEKAMTKTIRLLHGTVMKNYCIKCKKSYSVYEIAGKIPPKCNCGGIIKPNVVLYGEYLDDDILLNAVKDIEKADMLIIGGTSLTVNPAATLVNYYRGNKLILINKSTTPYDSYANLVIHDSISEVFKQITIK